MGLPSISTSPADYVVLDVETNGLKSKEDYLLSVSIYKPDDGREYESVVVFAPRSKAAEAVEELCGAVVGEVTGYGTDEA